MMLGILADAALRTLVLVVVAWAILAALRIRDSRVQSAVWRIVLLASLLMPVLMQMVVIHTNAMPAGGTLLTLPIVNMAARAGGGSTATGDVAQTTTAAISWIAVVWWLYVGVAALLVARLLAGLVLTWRMVRSAAPVRADCAERLDMRVCAATSVPVTFGSIVLVPQAYSDWPVDTRRAAIIHERSHVENGDFYIQILSSLNRAVFWFNPAAWWLHLKLTALAENISDDAALEVLANRPIYAEVLLGMSKSLHKSPAGVAMARPATVKARIERILASTALTSRLNWGKRVLLIGLVVPLVAMTAATLSPSATAQTAPKVVSVSPALLKSYVGYYKFDQGTPAAGAVLSVTREGDHLAAQLSGQGKAAIFPSAPNEFFYRIVRASITFRKNQQGHVTGLVLHQHGANMHATRTTPASAAHANATTSQKLAEQRKPHQVVSIDPRLLDGYVGRYRFTPKAILTISRQGDQLFEQLTGQPKFPIYPYGPKDFFLTVVAAQITFVTGPHGRATKLVLHQNGLDQTAPRIH